MYLIIAYNLVKTLAVFQRTVNKGRHKQTVYKHKLRPADTVVAVNVIIIDYKIITFFYNGFNPV